MTTFRSPRVPIEAPMRDRPQLLDELTVIWERKHDDSAALAVAA
jgi:hypothetical protein